jgi:hypothetical protein
MLSFRHGDVVVTSRDGTRGARDKDGDRQRGRGEGGGALDGAAAVRGDGGRDAQVALSSIVPVHMREQVSERIVQQYAADMVRPTQVFPPIVLFHDGERYRLADGMHRVQAAKTLDLPDFEARVLAGGERKAVEYAALEAPKLQTKPPYTDSDKQLRVKRMWETYPEWHQGEAQTSKRQIADSCGVSAPTVEAAIERYGLSVKPVTDKTEPDETPAPAGASRQKRRRPPSNRMARPRSAGSPGRASPTR